jgi:uncharacterized protein with FMN-binding domain
MRRAALTLIATVIGLLLLLGFKTGPRGHGGNQPLALAHGGPTGATKPSTKPTPTGQTHPRGPSTRPSKKPEHRTAPMRGKRPARTTSRTIDGATVNTPYGPVQVRITETNGRLTDVTPVQLPNDNPQSQQIAAYAAPLLRSEALKAGSAHIDAVSGASYDSQGYAQSLQSALDGSGSPVDAHGGP